MSLSINAIRTLKTNKESESKESYSYLDAFGYTEFELYKDNKGKHFNV